MRAHQSGGLGTSVRTENQRGLTQAERRVLQLNETGLKEAQEWEEGGSQVSLQGGGKIIHGGQGGPGNGKKVEEVRSRK